MVIAVGRNGKSLLSLSRVVPAETGQQACVLDQLSTRTLLGTPPACSLALLPLEQRADCERKLDQDLDWQGTSIESKSAAAAAPLRPSSCSLPQQARNRESGHPWTSTQVGPRCGGRQKGKCSTLRRCQQPAQLPGLTVRDQVAQQLFGGEWRRLPPTVSACLQCLGWRFLPVVSGSCSCRV